MAVALNNSKRRKEQQQLAKMDDDIRHQIAVVERELETCEPKHKEHYRALLRRLQQVLEMEPDR